MFISCQDKYTHMSLRGAIFTIESSFESWKNKRQLAVNSKDGHLDNFIEYGIKFLFMYFVKISSFLQYCVQKYLLICKY
jgi:hypothetical protein